MSLETKLKELQSEIGCCRYHMESKEFRDSLISVFRGEGWKPLPEFKPYELTIDGKRLMTGQEWLERFEHQLKTSGGTYTSPDCHKEDVKRVVDYFHEAAKRASNLEKES